jgi:alkylation response protein AidB-like acyl-CoA dehydrogenase
MRQPGVEVRPIVQMNRHASFNEVFLSDARIPVGNLVGDLHDGWRIARTTLSHERSFATMRRPSLGRIGVTPGRTTREAQAEADDHFATYVWYPQRAGRADLVVPRAQALGTAADPVVRQEIARLLSFVRANEWTAARARAAVLRARRVRSASSQHRRWHGVRLPCTRSSPARAACCATAIDPTTT